jgi:Aspartyl protease
MLRALPHSLLTFLFVLCVSTVAAQQTTIPFHLQDNLIRVPVTLNGQSLDAVLDSGTGGLGIDYAFAQSLHLDIGQSIGMVPGGGKPEPMYPVILDHLDFGPEHLSFTPAIAVDLSHLTASAGFPVHLLLGLPVFRQNILRVDYPAHTLTFLDAPPPCADPISFTIFGGSPLIAATVIPAPGAAPQTVHLIVDLGTRHYAAILGGKYLSNPAVQALQSSGRTTQIATGTGGAVMGTTASIASLTIGTRQFPNLTVALTHDIGILEKGTADGTLGVPLWQTGAVTFDYPHSTVCFNLPR